MWNVDARAKYGAAVPFPRVLTRRFRPSSVLKSTRNVGRSLP